jgi:3-hydroxyacyl-CoA dehydrogenase
MRMIRKAAVLGSGVMGSQIAALLASAGIPVYLFDIVPPEMKPGDSRSKLAEDAISKLKKITPSPIMHPRALALITPGNLEDDLQRVAEVDWVLEAVVERLDVKQSLWARVVEFAKPGTILSTNTSGLSCQAQVEVLPAEHRRNFLGTHFFNPPRYLKLLELIPVAETDPDVLDFMKGFAERTLGKGVVVCNDTPNFIANRIGTYGLAVTLRVMQEMGLGVDAVDAITGPAMGRPKSATFRTLDLVGLDTFAHVASNMAAATDDPEERELMQLPPFITQLLQEKRLGEKSGQGFYRKLKRGGESQILTLDMRSMGYGPRMDPVFPALEQTRRVKDPGERIKTLVNSPDEAGQFAWRIISPVLAFCARKLQEVANGDPNAIDRAMRWGYNWDIGPFEAWNALGVRETAERMKADGIEVPDWVEGLDRFPIERSGEEPLSFTVLKSEQSRIVKQTPGVTLVDLGDNVLGMELHGPKQSISEDFMPAANAAAEEVRRNWRGLVVSASASNFSVGFNIMLILLSAQAQQWALIERMVKSLQDALMQFKYLECPVVVAPYGMALGGGCEVAMQSARTVAAAETYMGLVEVGIGVIPAGGGTKEMAVRAAQMMPSGNSQVPNKPDLISFIGPAFETVATAKVSTSAAEARDLGYLRPTDEIVMNRDHLLARAKEAVLELSRQGYVPPQPAQVPVAGADGRAVLELAAFTLKNSGLASEYDVYIANKLAYVLTGGDLPAGTLVPEQYLLDLEREAFLHLAGQPKTQERIMYMLQKNKPLRN